GVKTGHVARLRCRDQRSQAAQDRLKSRLRVFTERYILRAEAERGCKERGEGVGIRRAGAQGREGKRRGRLPLTVIVDADNERPLGHRGSPWRQSGGVATRKPSPPCVGWPRWIELSVLMVVTWYWYVIADRSIRGMLRLAGTSFA